MEAVFSKQCLPFLASMFYSSTLQEISQLDNTRPRQDGRSILCNPFKLGTATDYSRQLSFYEGSVPNHGSGCPQPLVALPGTAICLRRLGAQSREKPFCPNTACPSSNHQTASAWLAQQKRVSNTLARLIAVFVTATFAECQSFMGTELIKFQRILISQVHELRTTCTASAWLQLELVVVQVEFGSFKGAS